ncbi:hypothetical protein ACOME3_010617 [Neoechinorhynchus agilis]
MGTEKPEWPNPLIHMGTKPFKQSLLASIIEYSPVTARRPICNVLIKETIESFTGKNVPMSILKQSISSFKHGLKITESRRTVKYVVDSEGRVIPKEIEYKAKMAELNVKNDRQFRLNNVNNEIDERLENMPSSAMQQALKLHDSLLKKPANNTCDSLILGTKTSDNLYQPNVASKKEFEDLLNQSNQKIN